MSVPSLFDKCRFLVGSGTTGRWVLLVVLGLLVSAFEAAGAVIILLLMGLVTGAETLELPVIGDLDALLPGLGRDQQLLASSAAIALFFVARAAVLVGQAYAQQRVAHNAGSRLSSRLMAGYLAMPYELQLQRNSSELIRNSYDTVQVFVREVLIPSTKVVSESLVVVGILAVLLVTAPLATLLAVGTLGPITLLVLRIVHPRVKRLGARSQVLSQESLQTLQQSLGGARDIKVLGREAPFRREFSRQRSAFARAQYLRGAAQQVPRAAIETALMLFIVGFFAVTVVAGGSTGSSLSILGLFAYAALRLKPPLANITSGINSLKFASPAVDDLHAELVLLEREAPKSRERRPEDRLPFEHEVRVEGVRFRYAGTDTDVLHDVDLTIRHGESIGIVGPTGGGKSTLLDVIMGLLRPQHGRVLVDGVDIATRTADWQANLGVVSQSVFLTDDTLRRNICLGIGDDDIDEDALAEALAMAQLDEFVVRLPAGLDTFVGERGVRVSGGQRQRIAIARALYHRPSVLVFDEGTSALDTITEHEIVAALEALHGQRTIITVAHRLSTVRASDRIFLLKDGRLQDSGTYEDLFVRNADFRSMAGAA